MDLWIRNQDKDVLTKCDDIRIATADGETKCVIRKYSNNNNWVRLGTYKSKERALEVLDEIQNILKPRVFVRANKDNEKVLLGALQKGVTQKVDMEFKELSTYVYEMPKE